jgi:hypothetical protein
VQNTELSPCGEYISTVYVAHFGLDVVGFTQNAERLVGLMLSDGKKFHLDKILNYPGLSYRKISKYKYLLEKGGKRWYLWPLSGRYQCVSPDGGLSEVFMGDLKSFYHRYLTEELKLPENFGKTWTKSEENLLYEMIEYSCTLRQIAQELQRHPVSVAVKLSKYVGDQAIQDRFTEDLYDVPVIDLISTEK